MSGTIPYLYNGQVIPLVDIPVFAGDSFTDALAGLLERGMRVCAYFGVPASTEACRLYAVCADDGAGRLYCLAGSAESHFASLTSRFPQVHLFEREIHEQTGLVPNGHPWLKPVRFPIGCAAQVGDSDFFRVKGDEVHEVAVGPVHAGIIEPGHFRFQCHGEIVHHLEISLGYQHRGIENALKGGPFVATPYQIETAAGDSTAAQMAAYCRIIESLGGVMPSPHADFIRCIAIELERCANHTGDLGALAGDVGYLPTMSYCGRIRGDFLNLTALLCGNRFGRGISTPGGVKIVLDDSVISTLSERLGAAMDDFISATGLLWTEPSVLDRFQNTGVLQRETAEEIGLVGPAARACGCARDVRQDHASGYYRFSHIPVSSHDSGDVFARATVRHREVLASCEFILTQLPHVPQGEASVGSPAELAHDSLAVSLVEGWRGELCHVAITGNDGRFAAYKIVDPSFHNWFGLALALRGRQISDFPLCNKSFNLSYCGFDL